MRQFYEHWIHSANFYFVSFSYNKSNIFPCVELLFYFFLFSYTHFDLKWRFQSEKDDNRNKKIQNKIKKTSGTIVWMADEWRVTERFLWKTNFKTYIFVQFDRIDFRKYNQNKSQSELCHIKLKHSQSDWLNDNDCLHGDNDDTILCAIVLSHRNQKRNHFWRVNIFLSSKTHTQSSIQLTDSRLCLFFSVSN